MRPSPSISILLAAGTRGRPGIVMISPQIAHDELGAGRQPYFSHTDDMIARRTFEIGVGGEAELRLGNADWKMAETLLLELGELVSRCATEPRYRSAP